MQHFHIALLMIVNLRFMAMYMHCSQGGWNPEHILVKSMTIWFSVISTKNIYSEIFLNIFSRNKWSVAPVSHWFFLLLQRLVEYGSAFPWEFNFVMTLIPTKVRSYALFMFLSDYNRHPCPATLCLSMVIVIKLLFN